MYASDIAIVDLRISYINEANVKIRFCVYTQNCYPNQPKNVQCTSLYMVRDEYAESMLIFWQDFCCQTLAVNSISNSRYTSDINKKKERYLNVLNINCISTNSFILGHFRQPYIID